MKFTEVDLHPDLQASIKEMGFEEMTQIQADCIGPGLEGRDIAGVSQTGTGKTVAFLLPVLHKILSEEIPGPAALIVTPTRELCLQIAEEAGRLTSARRLGIVAIYGGEEYRKQEEALAKNPEIIVATPGRLIDYVKQGKIDLSNVRFQILDEADRMFDMGFIRDVRYIMHKVPEDAQTMLFSATLSYYILRLASDFMRDPVEVRVEAETVAVDKIDQQLLHLGRQEKDPYLVNQLLKQDSLRAIVFTNYRSKVQHIERVLRRYGIAAAGISSLLDQKKRIRLLKNFKLGTYQVLVATDVASRGLDVDDITHVYNYDLPQDSESYVHRIGRTARAGRTGTSVSYCSEEDYDYLPRIQRYLGDKIPVVDVDVNMIKFPEGEFTRFTDGTEREEERRDGSRSERGGRGRRNDREGGRDRDRNRDRSESRDGARDNEEEPRANNNEGESQSEGEGQGRRRRRRGGRGRRRNNENNTGESRQPQGDQPAAPVSTEGMSIREQDRLAVLQGTRSTASGPAEEDDRCNGGGRRRSRNRNRNRSREGQGEGRENRGGRGGRGGSGRGDRDRANGEGEGRRRRRRRGGSGRRNNEERGQRPVAKQPEKKGLLSKIKGFFSRS